MDRPELLGFFPEELATELAGQPAFRARQVFEWLHRGADFDRMSNLPAALREDLKNRYVGQPVSLLGKRVSQLDVRYWWVRR